MATDAREQDWQIRLFIYQFFVDHARPPTSQETARQFAIPADEARAAYRRLHDSHALFLEPGTDSIRIANPLSAVLTDYQVHIRDRQLPANCAWDSLGIPAMLHADARIEARDGYRGEPIQYAVKDSRLDAPDELVVHFAVPFRRWYESLIHT